MLSPDNYELELTGIWRVARAWWCGILFREQGFTCIFDLKYMMRRCFMKLGLLRRMIMSRNLKVLLSTALVAVSLLTPEPTHGMDEASNSSAQLQPSGMQQLSQGANDTLEGVLGAGQNVLLRLSMDLSSLKKPVDKSQIQKGKLDIPVRLFLTDFMSVLTAHPVVHLTATVDVESTPPAYILPSKPSFFESYSQFTDWLNSAYFTNHVNMTYDI